MLPPAVKFRTFYTAQTPRARLNHPCRSMIPSCKLPVSGMPTKSRKGSHSFPGRVSTGLVSPLRQAQRSTGRADSSGPTISPDRIPGCTNLHKMQKNEKNVIVRRRTWFNVATDSRTTYLLTGIWAGFSTGAMRRLTQFRQ